MANGITDLSFDEIMNADFPSGATGKAAQKQKSNDILNQQMQDMVKQSSLHTERRIASAAQDLFLQGLEDPNPVKFDKAKQAEPQFTPTPGSDKTLKVKLGSEESSVAIPERLKGTIVRRLQPNETLVATFGNWEEATDGKGNKVVIEVPRENIQAIDPKQVFERQIMGSEMPSIDKEMQKLTDLTGMERIEKSLGVLQMVEEAMARRMSSLSTIAEQRSGLADANTNLEVNKLEDVRSGFTAKKPGALSKETEQAHALIGQAQLNFDRMMKNMVSSDPEYQKLEALSKNLMRSQQMAGVYLAREEREAEKTGWITPDVIAAYSYAYDADISDVKAAKATIYDRALAKKDKTFQTIISINKDNILDALVNENPVVRKAAFKIASKVEEESGSASGILQKLLPMVTTREANLTPDQLKTLKANLRDAPDKHDVETKITAPFLREKLSEALSSFAEEKYSNTANWGYISDPKLLQIISDAKLGTKTGVAHYRDVIGAYIPGDLDEQEFNRRVQVLSSAFKQTVQTEKPSWILPDMTGFQMAMAAKLDNEINRTTIKRLLQKMIPGYGAK